MNSIRAVIDWLVDGARSATLAEDVIAELCRRMVACDLPLWRVGIFVRTLHPDVAGRRFVWCPESGVSTSEALFSFFESDEFRASPAATIYDTCEPLRRRLSDGDCPDDSPFWRDLRAQGVTDYAGFPLRFTDGTIQVATWATRQPGGFTPEQFTAMRLSAIASTVKTNPSSTCSSGPANLAAARSQFAMTSSNEPANVARAETVPVSLCGCGST